MVSDDSSMSTWALDWLLAKIGYEREIDGTPFECCHCPFATQTADQQHDTNRADPGEGRYNCSLLSIDDIWGENPKCKPEDWRARAREELSAIRAQPLTDEAVDRLAAFLQLEWAGPYTAHVRDFFPEEQMRPGPERDKALRAMQAADREAEQTARAMARRALAVALGGTEGSADG